MPLDSTAFQVEKVEPLGGELRGRRVAKALNAAFVRSAREPGKYFDGHGLFLLVKPNGAKFWVQRITIQGKRREMGLGSPDIVTLAEARHKALANRKAVRDGLDPLQAKRAEAKVMTFEEAAREVHRLHLPTWRSAKHGATFLNSLESYAFPRLGALRVSDITAADVLGVLSPIWTEKAVTAKRVRQRIGMVMQWGIAQGWRADDPAESVTRALPKQSGTKSPRKALPYTEVPACLEVIRASGAGPSAKLAIEFAVLTAGRSGEVREAI